MQAVKDTYNDDTSNISGNVILLKIQTQLNKTSTSLSFNHKIWYVNLWYHMFKILGTMESQNKYQYHQ